jgi:hypothetical protein
MRKCSISFTSWITRLAASLELLSKATLTFILNDRRIIEYNFFFHAHMLKRCNNKITMIYKKYRNEYELSNRELGIYSVNSFTFPENTNIGRCPSAHISRLPRTVYTGADPAPSRPAHFYYTNFEDLGASHEPHQPWSTHSGWEDQVTYEQGEPSTSLGWGIFPTQELDNTRQDFQRGCASFSVRGNADRTTSGPYPFHAPPTNEYIPPPELHFGTLVNDYPAMSLHLTNLQ